MNKKGLSTWATIGSVVMLGLLLMIGFNVFGSTNKGVGKIVLSTECFSQDYDHDSYSNAIESSNIENRINKPEKSCPCDPPKYSRNVVLNPKIWDSKDGAGPYEKIFDYSKREKLKKITSISNDDYVFLTWYLDNLNNITDDADTRSYFIKLKEYMKKDATLKDLSFKTFCPDLTTGKDCTENYFKNSWFEDSNPSPVEFEPHVVCETDPQVCKNLMQTACANAKAAKDSGKV